MSNAIKRLLELEGLLKYHDHMYHTLDAPVISDSEYDLLKLEYDELANEYPDVLDPEVRPGFVDPPASLGKVIITEPMISVDKKKDKEKYNKWITTNVKTETVEEVKLDGLALRFIYNDGVLARIHTRGRNNIGGDVSHRRHLLKNIPDTCELQEDKAEVHFTGEAYCLQKDFVAYCERHSLDINDTDPRSTVSGLMKRGSSSERDTLPVYVSIYGASRNVRDGFETYMQLRDHFTDCGFDVPMLVDGNLREEFLNLTELPKLDYAIDGIVAKDNDLRNWEKEQTGEYYTYAVCYKFPTISLETKVTGIDWSLDNQGNFVGTLMYIPVEYGGTKMTRCKLDYAQSYFDKGLRIGSDIKVTKSNEIIPKLVALVTPGAGLKLGFPEKCPFCDVLAIKTDSGAKCENAACEGQLVKRLSSIFEIDGFNIHGLGDKRIERLVANGDLTRPSDLFLLDELKLYNAGVPTSQTDKLLQDIKDVTKQDISKWLFALSIPCLGKVRCVELSNLSSTNGLNEDIKFSDLSTFMRILTDSSAMGTLFGLEGVRIVSHVRKNQSDIEAFLTHYDFGRPAQLGMDGVPVAISGAWNGLTRRDLTEVLRQNDFVLSDSVTKSCKALITGSKPSPSKLETARRYKLPIFDITQIHDVAGIVSLLLNVGR